MAADNGMTHDYIHRGCPYPDWVRLWWGRKRMRGRMLVSSNRSSVSFSICCDHGPTRFAPGRPWRNRRKWGQGRGAGPWQTVQAMIRSPSDRFGLALAHAVDQRRPQQIGAMGRRIGWGRTQGRVALGARARVLLLEPLLVGDGLL